MEVNPFDLTGRVALVTGAARGIGLAVARGLAGQGAHVVAVDLADESAEVTSLAADFPEQHVRYRKVDVRDEEAVRASVDATVDELGSLDVLVNNAGTASRNGLDTLTDDEWYRDLDTNLRGMFLYCRAAEPHMKARGDGRIINVSSISGIMGGPRSGGAGGGRSGPAYAASKGGVIALTKWLAKELGEDGITCNSVAPGPIATALTADVAYALDDQVIKRMGTPEEVAAAVGYLAGPGAGYVTGQVLKVCGGAAIG
ncbi:NAD(P)-dependent dehydrogenase (short-subunit alcohol dehydrogenase family) [Prauserella sediminis]|uniref:NAD(P)-dependent dehydrogenase (Short-subunit alcohol dehydrogenase family) n=1 Tax=Prauserella sediminis TaxID=577680 RepID=A0A839XS15_9PSEU|nr:SDR family NAD(P)-dependent oxidoreductase [Prauserella sediminis]MBB3664234.1 NAD(P)-dependent dehydrogenase (short-subunit alcohol dehydrogenase family) [Prauserella sediminis]